MIDFIYNIPIRYLILAFFVLAMGSFATKEEISFTHNKQKGNLRALILLGLFLVSVILVSKFYIINTGYKPMTFQQKQQQWIKETMQKIKKENPIKPTEKKNYNENILNKMKGKKN